MTRIADFISHAAGVGPQTTVAQARALFLQAKDRRALAVMVSDRPVGLVTRETALTAADPQRPIGEVMDANPPLIEASLGALEACLRIAQDHGRGHDSFLVCEGETYLGVGSLHTVLAGLNQASGAGQAPLAAPGDDPAGKREFLDLISEELSAPLAAVLAMTERLERAPLGADAHSQVRAIREAGETLNRIVATAVDLTRAEHGILGLTPEPVLLRSLVDDLQLEWADKAARAGVTLLASFEGDMELSAMTDHRRLRQVFDSLVEAALVNTRNGSVEVGLKAHADGDRVRIEGRVRDTGPGQPPEKLARIFEPQSQDGAGSGLGVALARQIVLGMHGCIRAESNVGAGVSMIFDLLCEAPPAAKADTPQATPMGPAAAHILVVDDNATNRMVAEALCEMYDCTSECAVDGMEAVEIASSGRFDVILMDIKMPRMDGMAATQAIRALPAPAGATPIIALTANADPDDARAYLACGMCAVVEKPIKPERLLQAINDALAANVRRAAA